MNRINPLASCLHPFITNHPFQIYLSLYLLVQNYHISKEPLSRSSTIHKLNVSELRKTDILSINLISHSERYKQLTYHININHICLSYIIRITDQARVYESSFGTHALNVCGDFAKKKSADDTDRTEFLSRIITRRSLAGGLITRLVDNAHPP